MGRLTRRVRIRLVIAVIVLGLPVLVGGVVVWFIASGALQRRIEQSWSAELPGRLEIDALAVDALDTVVVDGSGVYAQAGDAPVLALAHARIRGSVFERKVGAVTLHGLRLDASGRNHPFLIELGEEIHRIYREMEVHPRIRVELDDAVVVWDDTPLLDAGTVLWDNRENQRQIAVRAQLAQGLIAFTGALDGPDYRWRLDGEDIAPAVLLRQVLTQTAADHPALGLLPERHGFACAGSFAADGSLRADLDLDGAPALGLSGITCTARAGSGFAQFTGDFVLRWQQGAAPLRGVWRWERDGARVELRLESGTIPVTALCDALAGIGTIPRLGRLQRLLLPRELDCAGSRLVVDLSTGALAGQLELAWRAPLASSDAAAARVSAQWQLAAGTLELDRVAVQVPGLVALEQLSATVDARHAAFSWSQLELAGMARSLVAARSGLPLADWLALTPTGAGRIEQQDDGLRFTLGGEAGAVCWQISGDDAGVVSVGGERLPARLFAGWLAPWRVQAGLARSLSCRRTAKGWGLDAEVERGELALGAHMLGWSGPLRAVLPRGLTGGRCTELQLRSPQRAYEVVLQSDDDRSTLRITAAELTDLLADARLALPLVLDGFSGRLALVAHWPGTVAGAPAAVELEWSDGGFGSLLSGVHAHCQARAQAAGHAVELDIDAGRLALPGGALDLAARPLAVAGAIAPPAGPPLVLRGSLGDGHLDGQVQALSPWRWRLQLRGADVQLLAALTGADPAAEVPPQQLVAAASGPALRVWVLPDRPLATWAWAAVAHLHLPEQIALVRALVRAHAQSTPPAWWPQEQP